MRLWSLHPKYLDRMGLLAVWREGLLAQGVLLQGADKRCPDCEGNGTLYDKEQLPCNKCKETGHIKTSYYNNPQLDRFKNTNLPIVMLGNYLYEIWKEAVNRGYDFNKNKIKYPYNNQGKIIVTSGQIEYEFNHLQYKLACRKNRSSSLIKRDKNLTNTKCGDNIEPHPLFTIIEGPIESWEKIK